MSNCCSTSASCKSSSQAKKHPCPIDGKMYAKVSHTTIYHHIKKSWLWQPKQQGYYFCSDPNCEVVYFGEDNSIIKQSDLRTCVGIKEQLDDSLICYCFGVTLKEAQTNPLIIDFVIKKTKDQSCACDTRNPSGKCCLKDFPK